MEIQVTLPDGTNRRYSHNTTIAQVAESISASLRKNAVAGRIGGRLVGLDHRIDRDSLVEIILADSSDGLAILRHSTAHLLAQAIKRIYGEKNVKLGIGPVIEDGFYYDIDIARPLSSEDLAAVEREMQSIIAENLPIIRRVVSYNEAVERFAQLEEPLKLELLRDLPKDEEISIYEQGEFSDLCRGPHLASTGRIKAFKLLSVAGAYWKGNADNQVLQRIYGTAFLKQAQLDEHLHRLEEAKKRDHRKLGKELGLFMFSEEAPGMPFYLPKGMFIRTELENFSREMQRQSGYEEVRTPLMMNNRLWEQSGHWDHYKDEMYFTKVDETSYALKPMNCPGHMLIFKNSLRSYRELPLRIAEYGQCHRHESSGALNGMMRVRTFCQDDAHLFVLPEQIGEEIGLILELIDRIYKVFGFSYKVELSTRPADYMGDEALWDQAEQSLERILQRSGLDYRINPGDGAFYGPKIDFHVLDALKRSWQCGTIQLDFQMPEKFDLTYIGEDNAKHRPVVIHRAVFGSIDRFMGILTEHFSGAFPLWLSPVQAKLLPVAEVHAGYAFEVKKLMQSAGLRVEVDLRSEKLGYKIREAQLEKVPYTLVLGDQEQNSGTVSVRSRAEQALVSLSVQELIQQMAGQIAART
ncbi:threonine--tRNA ligase [Paenibacillus sp. MMS20-IR301]|uniref:threonine--tRNA ligase n=1 Tax=Paenibacillus sp. MMS20-IR301 TaxID=2895946 RepID=UPI0028E8EE74|nr:threonine--tRNA ligase [Paenibacillus sp. MMS20-IR301]WNS45400.1 threonine--tRNA ligase [Paenibacillus sp. MMS20-IR301]